MKVNLEDIRIGVSAMTEMAQIGIVDKTGIGWKHKISIHGDFLKAVTTIWKGKKQAYWIGDDIDNADFFEVSVRKLTPDEIEQYKLNKK